MRITHQTITAMLCELIETHMEKCAEPFGLDETPTPHIIDSNAQHNADIDTVENSDLGFDSLITLTLSDGSAFEIRVAPV